MPAPEFCAYVVPATLPLVTISVYVPGSVTGVVRHAAPTPVGVDEGVGTADVGVAVGAGILLEAALGAAGGPAVGPPDDPPQPIKHAQHT